MTYRSISVLTLVRGRQKHLDNLLDGLNNQTQPCDELVIAYMQEQPPHVPSGLPFVIRLVAVPGQALPLARARNAAANLATSEVLAFLDVDCIPDERFVQRSREAIESDPNGVFLPEVRYLPATEQGWSEPGNCVPDYALLDSLGQRHPAKPDLGSCSVQPIQDFGELWGLAFILQAATWHRACGMDERYVGYGAEETDFGRRLEASAARLYWLGGTVCYHQHHTVHKPPLQHFDSIIRNAERFHERWGEWCMDYWLDDFAERGFIDRKDECLEVLRKPTEAEIAATRQGPEVRFS